MYYGGAYHWCATSNIAYIDVYTIAVMHMHQLHVHRVSRRWGGFESPYLVLGVPVSELRGVVDQLRYDSSDRGEGDGTHVLERRCTHV